jgi:hypothetical protein
MRTRQLGADVVFFPSQVGFSDADLSRSTRFPRSRRGPASPRPVPSTGAGRRRSPLVAVGPGWFDTIERAQVLAGRLPDLAATTSCRERGLFKEVAASGSGLGSSHVAQPLLPRATPPRRRNASGFDWTTAHGPVVTLRIVGVIRIPAESVVSFASNPLVLSGPGGRPLTSASALRLRPACPRPPASTTPSCASATGRRRPRLQGGRGTGVRS